jgi:hypothetical protein
MDNTEVIQLLKQARAALIMTQYQCKLTQQTLQAIKQIDKFLKNHEAH